MDTTLVAPAPPPQLELLGRRRYERFAAFLALTLGAYLLFDRAAAYVHIPGTPAYLGEACLAVGLWAFIRSRGYVWSAISGDAVLCALLAFFLWGSLRTLTNLRLYGVTWTLRDSALWYYSLFAVLVVATTLAFPRLPSSFAAKLGRLVPWMAVWLPIAVLLSPAGNNPAAGGGGRVHIRVPFTAVSIVSHKDGNLAIAAFLGLLALWLLPQAKRSVAGRRVWSFLLLATVLFAGTQNRGGLVAVSVATVIGAFLVQGLGRKVVTTVAVVALAFIGVSFWFPHLGSHSARSVSPSQLQTNIESLVGVNNQTALQGTVQDRKIQWSYVLELQNAQHKMVWGWGPGPNLGFGKATGIGDASLRSAHNSHLDVLARLGYVGLGLWILLWLAWFWRMFTSRSKLKWAGLDQRRRLVDVCLLTTIAILVNAFFDPSLESAQAALLLWTMFGFGVVLTNPRWLASVG